MFLKATLTQIIITSLIFSPAFAQDRVGPAPQSVEQTDGVVNALDGIERILEEEEKAGSLFHSSEGQKLSSSEVLGQSDYYYSPAPNVVGGNLTLRILSTERNNEDVVTIAVYDSPKGRRLPGLSRSITISKNNSPEETRIIIDQTAQSLSKQIESSGLVAKTKQYGERTPAGLFSCLASLLVATVFVSLISVVVRKISTRLFPGVAANGGVLKNLKAKWSGMRLDSKLLLAGSLGITVFVASQVIVFSMGLAVYGLIGGRDVPEFGFYVGLPLLMLVMACAG